MKIFKYTTIYSLLLFSACGNSFLEVEPIGQLGKEQLFTDVTGLNDALVGSYNLVSKFYQSQYGIYGDLRADDVERAVGGTQNYMLSDYNYNFDENDQTGATQNIWSTGYEALNNINNVLASASSLKTTSARGLATIENIEGQALVLRGLMFFALSNIYAQQYNYTADASHLGIPIPLVTPLPSEKVSRASMKDTYAQIIKDFENGIKLLDGKQSSSRIYASTAAAKALLCRIYLYMGNYELSLQYADEVINSGNYALVSSNNYRDMFMGNAQFSDYGSISSEVIWQFSLNTRSSNYLSSFYSDRAAFLAYPKISFLNLFEVNDIRKSMYEFQQSSQHYMSLKNAKDINIPDINWPVNVKVIRSAELYLNRAEAFFYLKQYDKAVADLKIIQSRALNVAPESITIAYTTPDQLFELIKIERRKELAFEGHRIYDIMRYKESMDRGTSCNSATCKLTYPNDLFIMPIPKAELDANNLMKPNPTVNN